MSFERGFSVNLFHLRKFNTVCHVLCIIAHIKQIPLIADWHLTKYSTQS